MPLPTDPLLGQSTLNLGLIDGGVAPNVIPPSATAQLLIRTVEPSDSLKSGIRALPAHLREHSPLYLARLCGG